MDTKELARRYGMSEQGIRKYLRQNLSKLNEDSEHVIRVGRSWQIDVEGLKLLDKMRGYVEPIIQPPETLPNELEKLREDNRRLMGMLLASQKEIINLQRELLSLQAPKQNWLDRLKKLFRKSSDK